MRQARQTESGAPRDALVTRRDLGSHTAGRPGPTLVVIAGLHGNEPAGILAFQRVLDTLRSQRPPLRGLVTGFAGNLGALGQNLRFLSRDLNRAWRPDRVRRLLAADPATLADEDHEQHELLVCFAELLAHTAGSLVFLDMHSTSAGGAPFCAISDQLRNRTIALRLPVPVILGLDEHVSGTLTGHLGDLGHTCIVFEGGRHDDPQTVEYHESAIWLALAGAGALRREDIPNLALHRARLELATRSLPHVVEVRYRHPVEPDDRFVMRPGYQNFQRIRKGEELARDRRGAIHSRQKGRILMPLYQTRGDDGFFVVRDVRPGWLTVSRVLRRLRLDALLPLLPGVRRHPRDEGVLLIDPRLARFLAVQVMHLFGFRRLMPEGREIVFAKPPTRRASTARSRPPE